MTILSGDIKIFESDRMDDTDDGGGMLTGTEIQTNQANNMFKSISSLLRIHGGVMMRKGFGVIDTQNTDDFLGCHTIISKIPVDEKLNITLFDTKNWFDRRLTAQRRIENYLAKGSRYTGNLLGTQYQDGKVLTMFQPPVSKVPDIGDVLFLVSGNTEQAVRVVDVAEVLQELTDGNGVYEKKIVTLTISDGLDQDFVGLSITRIDQTDPITGVFNSIVADAAQYFGSHKIVEPFAAQSAIVKVDSVYNQLLPSSESTSAVVDRAISDLSLAEVDNSLVAIDYSIGYPLDSIAGNSTELLLSPIATETLQVNGDAAVDLNSLTSNGLSVDYIEGAVTNTDSFSKTLDHITYHAAVYPSSARDTDSIPVSLQNRSLVYTKILSPVPKKGSVIVSYLAQGNWYDITEKAGETGSLTLNQLTGSVIMNLTSLPDAGSNVIIAYSPGANYIKPAPLTGRKLYFELVLGNEAIDADTIAITMGTESFTVNASGQVGGNGSGFFDNRNQTLRIYPDKIVTTGTPITCAYSNSTKIESAITNYTISGTTVTVDIGATNINPGSVDLVFTAGGGVFSPAKPNYLVIGYKSALYVTKLKDDGVGGLIDESGNTVTGSVNYATGIVTFDTQINKAFSYHGESVSTRKVTAFHSVQTRSITSQVSNGTVTLTPPAGAVNVSYSSAAAAPAAQETYTFNELKLDFSDINKSPIVESSLSFKLANGRLYSIANSKVYLLNNDGTKAVTGVTDLVGGIITLTNVYQSSVNTALIYSLLFDSTIKPSAGAVFRVPGAPVLSESLSLRFVSTAYSGEQVALSDVNGLITGNGVTGVINIETGVVELLFGEWVDSVGNESEDWYVASNVRPSDNKVFHPMPAYIDTLRYNAVVVKRTQLSAEVLGLNPVRLPSDGRVPVYNVGGLVVILNEATESGNYANNQTVTLPRQNIDRIFVRDAGLNPVDVALYTADRVAGTVGFNDISSVSKPIFIIHRIEHSALLEDVQLTGELSLSAPVLRDFPVLGTLVCSAAIYGNLFARTSIPFDQSTWTAVWSDTRIGGDTLASLNVAQYPIELFNTACITERWALIFTSSTTFNIVGENLGVIGIGTTTTDTAPVNLLTGQIYWRILAAALGLGWSAGNVIRFNTYGAGAPFWLIESVSQGMETDPDFSSCIEIRGDVNVL